MKTILIPPREPPGTVSTGQDKGEQGFKPQGEAGEQGGAWIGVLDSPGLGHGFLHSGQLEWPARVPRASWCPWTHSHLSLPSWALSFSCAGLFPCREAGCQGALGVGASEGNGGLLAAPPAQSATFSFCLVTRLRKLLRLLFTLVLLMIFSFLGAPSSVLEGEKG